MKGKIPMAPQLGFPSVDVRDVAAAAIDAAVTAPQLVGRFVCVEGTYTIKDLAALASQSFPLVRCRCLLVNPVGYRMCSLLRI
jgi:nucleoside-diphosphate-sugar epimerase